MPRLGRDRRDHRGVSSVRERSNREKVIGVIHLFSVRGHEVDGELRVIHSHSYRRRKSPGLICAPGFILVCHRRRFCRTDFRIEKSTADNTFYCSFTRMDGKISFFSCIIWNWKARIWLTAEGGERRLNAIVWWRTSTVAQPANTTKWMSTSWEDDICFGDNNNRRLRKRDTWWWLCQATQANQPANQPERERDANNQISEKRNCPSILGRLLLNVDEKRGFFSSPSVPLITVIAWLAAVGWQAGRKWGDSSFSGF